ncbi:hypothetical protein R7X75_02485 [Mesomycoplasma ovipneumoniae]|nr:hypothetical protein [Mesomycoplasma ovipneumoniae]
MTIFFKNSIKFTSSLSTSLIGSEAFKFSSSLYIFKITGDFLACYNFIFVNSNTQFDSLFI